MWCTFRFVNYTTLRYGDVIPLERCRLLGQLTAMNGVLAETTQTRMRTTRLRQIKILLPCNATQAARGQGSDLLYFH